MTFKGPDNWNLGSALKVEEGPVNIIINNCEIENVKVAIWITVGGSATIEHNEIDNCWDGIVLIDGSGHKVIGNSISNCLYEGIILYLASNVDVIENSFEDLGGTGGIFTYVCTDIQIEENSFKDCRLYDGEITLQRTINSLIKSNSFVNSDPNLGAITLIDSRFNTTRQNNFIDSNLTGWLNNPPWGPFNAAVLIMDYFAEPSEGNYIFEMKWPEIDGVTICDMILDLTDDPTTFKYDGTNIIHHYQPCESLAKKDFDLTKYEARLDHRIPFLER